MNPRWRASWPEGYYHVYNRGVRRLQIFAEDADRRLFMRMVARAARRFGVVGIAWCLVTNHYHLLLRAGGKALGKMLQEVEKTYARLFNQKIGFNGALFQGRFGATWIPDDEALAYVSRYIHGNALDEGAAVELYPWSSFGAYMGRGRVPDWMDLEPVLDWAGGPEAYLAYTRALPPKKKREGLREQAQDAFVLFLEEKLRAALRGRKHAVGRLSFPVLTCLLAVRDFAIRPRVLADHFGFASGACVSALVSRMEKRLDERPALKGLLRRVLTK